MKRSINIVQWLALALALMFVLAACERTIPRDDQPTDGTAPDQTTPIVVTDTPAPDTGGQDGYPAPGEGEPAEGETGNGEQPAEEQPPDEEGTGEGEAGEGQAGEGETGDTGEGGDGGEQEQPEEEAGDDTSAEAGGSYTIQAGDTLFAIAQRFGVTVNAIVQANPNITNPNDIDVGMVITIPSGDQPPAEGDEAESVHIVQPGENLFRIGLRYGFTVQELADYNDIANPARIEVGQVIRIPPE